MGQTEKGKRSDGEREGRDVWPLFAGDMSCVAWELPQAREFTDEGPYTRSSSVQFKTIESQDDCTPKICLGDLSQGASSVQSGTAVTSSGTTPLSLGSSGATQSSSLINNGAIDGGSSPPTSPSQPPPASGSNGVGALAVPVVGGQPSANTLSSLAGTGSSFGLVASSSLASG